MNFFEVTNSNYYSSHFKWYNILLNKSSSKTLAKQENDDHLKALKTN